MSKFWERKREPFECPYDLKSCDHVDTSTLTMSINCSDCERHDKGIRPTGGCGVGLLVMLVCLIGIGITLFIVFQQNGIP